MASAKCGHTHKGDLDCSLYVRAYAPVERLGASDSQGPNAHTVGWHFATSILPYRPFVLVVPNYDLERRADPVGS